MTDSIPLVAGVGNIFLGDDGFGVEVVQRLLARPSSRAAHVVDFGIRGLDLTYALLDHERVILVDAAPRGGAPGTLYVIEPDLSAIAGPSPAAFEAHGVGPAQALSAAHALGGRLRFVRIVGCEPALVPDGDDVAVGLSAPVAAAVDRAVTLVEELLETLDA